VKPRASQRLLVVSFLAYFAGSLFHFIHNAEFLAEYPNLPATWTRAGVYGAWLAVTAVGLLGGLLVRGGYRFAGLIVVGLYAMLGFYGFAHYYVAPMSAHTPTMHLTIWLEAATALLLLLTVANLLLKARQ
jgi:hypothetical protein